MTRRKWVSSDRLPCMALWWEWEAESLWISRVVGFRAAVIWFVVSLGKKGRREGRGRTLKRMLSSTGMVDMVESRRKRIGKLRGNIRLFEDLYEKPKVRFEFTRQISWHWRQEIPRLSYTRKELPPTNNINR